jgi:uncharacterized protein (TIGR03382 family)
VDRYVVALCLAFSACTAESIDGASEAIVGGTRETGYREVVAVQRLDGAGRPIGLCSGTVVASRHVLTAKHCVFAEDSPGVYRALAPAELRIVVGDDVTRSGGIEFSRAVNRVTTTPGVLTDDDISMGLDIAILRTTAGIGVPARQIARARPRRTNPLEIVGFGRTVPGEMGAGVKFHGDASAQMVFLGVFEVGGGSHACQGDSGGPAIDAAGRVIGVASFVSDRDCADGRSFYSEVFQNLALIETALGTTAFCEPVAETCNGADDNCDGIVDEGCGDFGDDCRIPEHCASGICEIDGDMGTCGLECDPSDAMPDCPARTTCVITGCGLGRCRAIATGSLTDGQPCTDDLECASAFCFELAAGGSICARQCRAASAACPTDMFCDAGELPCGGCRVPTAEEPLPFGAPCTDPARCMSGLCTDFCTSACTTHAECPAGFRCGGTECVRGDPRPAGDPCAADIECADDAPTCAVVEGRRICAAACDGTCASEECVEGFCVPPGLALGEPCTAGPECRSGICAGVCTRLCESATDCPDGFDCTPAGDENGCFPVSTPPPADDGGCSTSRSTPTSLAFVLLAAIGALRRRRH